MEPVGDPTTPNLVPCQAGHCWQEAKRIAAEAEEVQWGRSI